VQSLDQDRILRRFLNLVTAILRTNYYQRTDKGDVRDTLAFKLSSRLVEGLPEPVPLYEIFVYSPRVEAVHLRFGRVARGGIRWSDRREDFRTEVLGLVKAQFVKNAVIVPSGAKGGFVPRRLTADMTRDQVAAEGVQCYTLFIEALLELTDNLSIENPSAPPVPPAQTVCHDEPDPYLVVAADKGTATFSDTANGIAKAHGFWLGDAFASGGSNGYDHKAMAITARGAWEAVKRHFRELGTDIQMTPFEVVGVGDMSGDVFGNGMLLSRKIKLVAAFDHRDIFIDPTPDTEASFEERKRLFALPRSSWQDYDKRLISKGGGVFSRKLKSIPLTDEIRAALDITDEALAPNDLMRAILIAKVHLLWFGGIGTYVKARAERNADVGDSANDLIRIDGEDIRAKVVGEGANLGCTQRGRVAYALQGGKINTDAIDNSAGVDCSDHEVNIKILLDSAVAQGALKEKARNQLLKAMTDDVAAHVLLDNYNQTLALTLAESTAKQDVDAHARFIRVLEREGRLKREVERLPSEDEIAERKAAGIGLTRPEIAVLLAYSKIKTYEELLASDVPDETALQHDLISYLPPVLAKEYPTQLHAHRLRREIIATCLSNEMTNIGGLTFVTRMKELVGADTASVARAYSAVCAVFDLLARRAEVNALDNRVSIKTQIEMHVALRSFLRRQTIWFAARPNAKRESIGAMIRRYHEPIATFTQKLPELCSPYVKNTMEKARQHYLNDRVPQETARAMSLLEPLLAAGDIADLSIERKVPIEAAARAHAQIGEKLGFERLLAAALRLTSQDHWERLAIRRITEDLIQQQRVLAGAALVGSAGDASEWLKVHAADVRHINTAFDELEAAGGLTPARLALAVGHLRDLASAAA
jgi:glutamate dehydrogenase